MLDLDWKPSQPADAVRYYWALNATPRLIELGMGAVPELMNLLKEGHGVTVCEALIGIGDRSIIESVFQLFESELQNPRESYLKALVELLVAHGDARCATLLLRALDHATGARFRILAEASGSIKEERVQTQLLRHFKQSFTGRNACIKALGKIGDVQAVGSLIEPLRGETISIEDGQKECTRTALLEILKRSVSGVETRDLIWLLDEHRGGWFFDRKYGNELADQVARREYRELIDIASKEYQKRTAGTEQGA